MGLGYALSEEIHFRAGAIHETNFDSYVLPRFSWVPTIDTVILEADDAPPYGGGEPAIILTGAVIANAVHDATGARLVELPMSPARVRARVAAKTQGA
jgi:CO/xanthine dehydrogenase Mo-binding subunit